MKRQDEIRDFIIEGYIDVDSLKQEYPHILFYPLSDRITIIQVPSDANEEFEELRGRIKTVFVPLIYGLNATAALEASNVSQFHTYSFGTLRGEGVLIGFVDTGIAYTNKLFQYEDNTTRIVSLWDQTIEGSAPGAYSYGTEYTSERINEALLAPDPYTIVPSRDEIGHGTFLAGVAAGNDRSGAQVYTGGAPDAMLIVVKLRPAREYLREYYVISQDAIAYQDDNILQGISYIVSVANKQNKPVVICIGLGNNLGAHNGTTIAERLLKEISVLQGTIVALSAGNEANKGHHFSSILRQDGEQTFEVNVASNENGFVMQLWAEAPDKIAMSITSPLGRIIKKVPLTLIQPQEFSIPLEPTQITLTYDLGNFNTGGQRIQVRMKNPTPGIWRFTVYGELIVNGTYNVWLPREGFIKAETRFLRPDPFITVCIPSTQEESLVLGAYNNKDDSIYAASGRGPTTNQIIKPDLIAPGVNILGPTPNGGFTSYTGTSVSAAITASACALLMQWAIIEGNSPLMNTRVARTILIRGARRTPGTVYPNPIEGYGKLDLINSINLV